MESHLSLGSDSSWNGCRCGCDSIRDSYCVDEVPDWSTALGFKQVVQMSGVFEEIMFYPVVDLDTIISTMNKFAGVYKAPGKES